MGESGWTGRTLDFSFYVTAAATPSGEDPGDWILNKLHGGAVECRSVVGEGTTFTLRFPLAEGSSLG